MKLEASGLVVTKYALNGWTIKCIDRTTGEEIYYNTKIPTGQGSWASEAEALKAIGTSIANEFSRDFFLAHVTVSGPARHAARRRAAARGHRRGAARAS